MMMMIAKPETPAHLLCHRFHSRLRCARFDYLCHLLWHLSLHDSRFCLCQGQAQTSSSSSSSSCSFFSPAPRYRILFGRRLFMAALLNINFIAFALAHLGLLWFTQRELLTRQTSTQTDGQSSRQADRQTDRRQTRRTSEWTGRCLWIDERSFIAWLVRFGSFYGLLKEQHNTICTGRISTFWCIAKYLEDRRKIEDASKEICRLL